MNILEKHMYDIGEVSQMVYWINESIKNASEESKGKMKPLIYSFLYGTGVKTDDSGFIPDSYRELESIVERGKSLKVLECIQRDIAHLEDEDDDGSFYDDSEELGEFLDPDYEEYFERCMERD